VTGWATPGRSLIFVYGGQRFQKRVALLLQPFFKPFGAIAMAARPWLNAVFMTAMLAVVRVLDAQQFEKFLPVGPFLGQRYVAKTGFHPVRHPVVADARLLQVPSIFVAGDRTLAERAVGQGVQQGLFPAGFYTRFDKVTHGLKIPQNVGRSNFASGMFLSGANRVGESTLTA